MRVAFLFLLFFFFFSSSSSSFFRLRGFLGFDFQPQALLDFVGQRILGGIGGEPLYGQLHPALLHMALELIHGLPVIQKAEESGNV